MRWGRSRSVCFRRSPRQLGWELSCNHFRAISSYIPQAAAWTCAQQMSRLCVGKHERVSRYLGIFGEVEFIRAMHHASLTLPICRGVVRHFENVERCAKSRM